MSLNYIEPRLKLNTIRIVLRTEKKKVRKFAMRERMKKKKHNLWKGHVCLAWFGDN